MSAVLQLRSSRRESAPSGRKGEKEKGSEGELGKSRCGRSFSWSASQHCPGSKAALKTRALQTLTRQPVTSVMREAFGVRSLQHRFSCAGNASLVHGTNARVRSFSPFLLFHSSCLLGLAFAFLILPVFTSFAQDIATPTNTIRFRAVDIFVDSTNKPLAAYQLEFTASAAAKIVGIEGGEHAAFKEAPFYDAKAMQHERVIIGAFSTAAADKLPTGKTRVATIHLQTTGELPPRFEVQVKTAATTGGKKISVHANAEEKQRNENEKASGQK